MISFLILINIVCAFELQSFQVEFLGISAANVEMHTIDTVYHNHNSKLIHFKTESTGLIKYFFRLCLIVFDKNIPLGLMYCFTR